jgi:hypothetical protein
VHGNPLGGGGEEPPAGPVPRSSWTKAQIVAWLAERGVTLDEAALDELTKAELLDLAADLLDEDSDG